MRHGAAYEARPTLPLQRGGRCLRFPDMHFIKEILAVRPYRLTLRFSTGEVRVVDLEATLRAKPVTRMIGPVVR